MKPWEMILAHQFSEAAKIYETQLESKPGDAGLLGGHATALLALGKFEEALKRASQANAIESAEMKGETQPYIEMVGSILWILGRRDEAIQTLRTAVDGVIDGSIKYADNAGGVSQGLLLWYAGVTAADEKSKTYALKYLSKLTKKSRVKYWPGPLALFALGQMPEEEVLVELCGTNDLQESVRQAKDDLLKRRCLVQSLFYFATQKRAKGNEEQCRIGMAKCTDMENPVLEVEWYLARAEKQNGRVTH